jgi:hypothetical protein
MFHIGWLVDTPWWGMLLWLPALAFAFPFGSDRKEHRS